MINLYRVTDVLEGEILFEGTAKEFKYTEASERLKLQSLSAYGRKYRAICYQGRYMIEQIGQMIGPNEAVFTDKDGNRVICKRKKPKIKPKEHIRIWKTDDGREVTDRDMQRQRESERNEYTRRFVKKEEQTNNDNLMSLQQKAAAAGMSYGQYMAQIYHG